LTTASRGLHAKLAGRFSRHAGLRLFRLFSRTLALEHGGPPDGLRVGLLSERDALDLCRVADLNLREDSVAAAYARGDLCAAAFDAEAVVGYCWSAFAPLHHLDGVSVKFGPEAVWTYKSLVRPSHRGRGIAPHLYRFADTECRARDRTSSLICVESHNASSVSAALRAGYAPLGGAGYIRRGPLFLDWCSGPVRKRGVSFFIPRNA